MKVLDPGHLYELQVLDGGDLTVQLRFVKREGAKFPGNVGHYPGTNMQEVLRALINRLAYLDNQQPDPRNTAIISKLADSIFLLEQRAAEHHERKPPTWSVSIMGIPCRKCGHVGCEGTCHSS